MFKEAKFKMGYADEVHSQVLELPYAGEELSMVILLPDEDTDLAVVSPWQWVWVSKDPAWVLFFKSIHEVASEEFECRVIVTSAGWTLLHVFGEHACAFLLSIYLEAELWVGQSLMKLGRGIPRI